MKPNRVLGAGLLLAMSFPLHATVLYDGSLNTVPNSQGWNYLTDPVVGASVSGWAAGGVTYLDTTAVPGDSAGYFSAIPLLGGIARHPGVGTLDRWAGYRIDVDFRVIRDQHYNNDRAGLSMIVLSDDHKGVEIGFWENEVWVQHDNPLFIHGEGGAFDTTSGMNRYTLLVKDNTYEMRANGNRLFAGNLRDYSGFTGMPVGSPYGLQNFIFFGDDTGSAAGIWEIGRMELGPLPEPMTLLLLSCAIPLLRRRTPAA